MFCYPGEKPDPNKVFQMAASLPKPQLEAYPIIDTENQSTINIIAPSPVDPIVVDTPQVSLMLNEQLL